MTAIQKYEELGFTNDFMFSRIMQDQKICKPFLEMILDIKIDHIEYLESQKTIDLKVDAKSVRLDIFVDDGKTVYNCEMQTSFFKNIPKRSRYYQGFIDMDLIEKGADYSKLKKSFVIFILILSPETTHPWVCGGRAFFYKKIKNILFFYFLLKNSSY